MEAYNFGNHIDTSKTGPLKIDDVRLDPKGFALIFDITTQEIANMYMVGRYSYNPHDSFSLVPNLYRAVAMIENDARYEVKAPSYPVGTRMRFSVVYTPGELSFYENRELLGSVPCDNAHQVATNYLFPLKTKVLCSRVLIEDNTGAPQHDFKVVGEEFKDVVTGRIAEPANFMEIKSVHSLTLETGNFIELGKGIKYETSPGFKPNKITIGGYSASSLPGFLSTTIGTVNGLPKLGKHELKATDSKGNEFSMDVELLPPAGWSMLTYDETETNERSLTFQVGRHPVKDDQLLFDDTDKVQVDEFNVVHPIAEHFTQTFYIIDKGGMFPVTIGTDKPEPIPEPDNDIGIDLAVGESITLTRTATGIKITL